MKNQSKLKKQGSLTQMLLAQYLIFSIAVFLVLVLISMLSAIPLKKVAFYDDIEGLLPKIAELEDVELAHLETEKYLGKAGDLVALDENGTVLYASGPTQYGDFLERELKCIPDCFESTSYVTKLEDSDSEVKYVVFQQKYEYDMDLSLASTEENLSEFTMLDKNLKVLDGTLFPKGSYLSPQEMRFLNGQDQQGRYIYKAAYRNASGKARTLLIMIPQMNENEYIKAALFQERSRWLIPIFYLLIAAFGAWMLGKKIQKLISPLNDEVLRFTQGLPSNLTNYQGPNEFAAFAKNFSQLEDKLLQSEWQRKQLHEQRQRLLADISHDLKTPITVIQGYAVALRDGRVPPEDQQQYLDTIIYKTEKMSELLNNFHEYSKLEHPDIPTDFRKKNICDVVQSYFAMRYQDIELQGFHLVAEIPETSAYCKVDEKLFYRALENLVDNSMKYNPPGTTVFVKIQIQNTSANISIGDDGNGIPENLQENLFDAFVIGDAARGKAHGSGLGLSIVKKIVELHDGYIALRGVPTAPYHTEFVISLPIIETVVKNYK